MADKKIKLKILTPKRIVLDKDVDFVLFRTTGGDMGVLYGHEPYTAPLDYGVLRAYINHEQADTIAVMGGFVTVCDNEVVVISRLAEQPDKIEEAIANTEKERLENRQHEQAANIEMHRVEKALRSILVQMDISSYSIIKGHGERQE